MSLRIFYVDIELGHEYWTWAVGTFRGGEFTSRAAAKWDAAERAYVLLEKALAVLRPAYDKAVERHGRVKGDG